MCALLYLIYRHFYLRIFACVYKHIWNISNVRCFRFSQWKVPGDKTCTHRLQNAWNATKNTWFVCLQAFPCQVGPKRPSSASKVAWVAFGASGMKLQAPECSCVATTIEIYGFAEQCSGVKGASVLTQRGYIYPSYFFYRIYNIFPSRACSCFWELIIFWKCVGIS